MEEWMTGALKIILEASDWNSAPVASTSTAMSVSSSIGANTTGSPITPWGNFSDIKGPLELIGNAGFCEIIP
jgi:hypothetical protein